MVPADGTREAVTPDRTKTLQGEHSTSAWALMAAIILLLLGLAIVLASLFLILGPAQGTGGIREVILSFGIVLLGAGIAHVYAAILIWAHRSAGRTLGIIIAAAGTLLLAGVVAIGFRLNAPPGSPGAALNLLIFLYPLPHLLVLIGLLAGRGHFPASSGPGGPATWR